MAERGAIWLITIAALIILANAHFNISDFEYVEGSSSVESNWTSGDKINPFSAAGNDEKIWLVSRRSSFVDDPVKPGGIVSTLHLANNTWTHRPHTLDMDKVDFKLFSLHGRLIMLVLGQCSSCFTSWKNVIKYGKLYSWNELEWTQIPFDPSTIENPVGIDVHLAVTVPDQSSNIAFLAASSNDYRTTKAVVSKLEINFDANSQPIGAKVTVIHRSTYSEPGYILATPINDGQLYVFWYGPVVTPGEIVDLKTNVTRPFEIMPTDTLVQRQILLDDNKDKCFQFRDRLIFVGRIGGHVWSFDLNMHRLQDASPVYPPTALQMGYAPNTFVFDQTNGLMYTINLYTGVFKAKIDL